MQTVQSLYIIIYTQQYHRLNSVSSLQKTNCVQTINVFQHNNQLASYNYIIILDTHRIFVFYVSTLSNSTSFFAAKLSECSVQLLQVRCKILSYFLTAQGMMNKQNYQSMIACIQHGWSKRSTALISQSFIQNIDSSLHCSDSLGACTIAGLLPTRHSGPQQSPFY